MSKKLLRQEYKEVMKMWASFEFFEVSIDKAIYQVN